MATLVLTIVIFLIEQIIPYFTKILFDWINSNNLIGRMAEICFNIENVSMSSFYFLNDLKNVILTFAISLAICKFMKKGFETYILWMDGDPDEDPLELLFSFAKALIIMLCFDIIYSTATKIMSEFIQKLLNTLGQGAQLGGNYGEGAGLVDLAIILVFAVTILFLLFQFYLRGAEMFILRLGLPLACVGLMDSDKGVFGPYVKKFIQVFAVCTVQLVLVYISIILIQDKSFIIGLIFAIMAKKTPQFLSEFLPLQSSSGGGMGNKIMMVNQVRTLLKGVKG